MKEKYRRYAFFLTILLVCAMTGAAELLQEKEIIFPEITALAVGAWAAPKQLWKTDRLRIWASITLFAVMGVLIVRCIPLPIYAQMILAFAVSSCGLLWSGTNFAPMISAMVLPVLMQTDTWIYPVSASALAAVIVLVQMRMEKIGWRSEGEFMPARLEKSDWIMLVRRVLTVAVLAAPALWLDMKFAAAPPLLVAFTSMTEPGTALRKKPAAAVMVVTACAAAGILCRYGLTGLLGLPLTVSAAAATVVMLAVMSGTGIYLPPAGAITILAMLIPADQMLFYPLQIAAGFAALVVCALVIAPEREEKYIEDAGEEGI